MGSSSSKPTTDNTGLANGNLINNGQIIERVEADMAKENVLIIILIVLKFISLLIICIKWFTKHVRRQQQRNQQIERVIVQANNQL